MFFLSATLLQLKDAISDQDPNKKGVFCGLCYTDNLIRSSQGFILSLKIDIYKIRVIDIYKIRVALKKKTPINI